jgi:hypothetical protein
MKHFNIADANAHQHHAVQLMNMPGSFHATNFPIITLETSQGNLAWDQNQG